MNTAVVIGSAGTLAILALSIFAQRRFDPQGSAKMPLKCKVLGHHYRTLPVKQGERTYQRVICKCGDIIASNEPGA